MRIRIALLLTAFAWCGSLYAQTPAIVQISPGPNSELTTIGTFPGTAVYKNTLPQASLSGNNIAVIVQYQPFNATISSVTVTDSASNSYTLATTGTGTNGNIQKIYYHPNTTAGVTYVTASFAVASQFPEDISVAVVEMNNVATSSPVDVSHCNSATSATITSGAMTIGTSGDLVIQTVNSDPSGGSIDNPQTSFTAGSQSNISWLFGATDLHDGSGLQYGVYSNTGSFNPTFTQASSQPFLSCAIAFKAASAGTPAPTTTPRINAIFHPQLHSGAGSPYSMQVPVSGNAVVIGANSGAKTITAVSSTPSCTWNNTGTSNYNNITGEHVALWYALGCSLSNTTKISISYDTTSGDATFFTYDLNSPNAWTFNADSCPGGFGTCSSQGGASSQSTSQTYCPACFTPSSTYGILFGLMSQDFCTSTGATSPSGSTFDAMLYSGNSIDGPEYVDENNGMMHKFFTSSPGTVTGTFSENCAGSSGNGTLESWAGRMATFSTTSGGGTINAANCSSSAVQTALNSVGSDGTTVVVPSCGSTSWTSGVTYNQVYSTILQGGSTTSGTCAPGGTCTATDNTNIAFNTTYGLTINTAAGKSFRMTGFSITVNSGPSYGAISINGASASVRIDHNHINDLASGDHTVNWDQAYGVMDHNFIDSTNQSNSFFIQPTFNGGGGESDGEANYIWTQPENFGTNQFVYMENNLIQNIAFVYDCDFGGKIAFRYNIVGTNTRIQTHGVGSGAQRRGCRAMENYNNTYTFSATPNTLSFAFLVDYESGTGMWWGNTITAFTTFLRQQEVRANNATYTMTPTPNGWGYAGTDFNGTGSCWDQNSNTGTGYRALDQIGSGAGDLLTGSFPSLINSTTGTCAWPHQAAVPTYAWMNTLNTNTYATNHYWQNYESPARPIENTDYYVQLPNVDNGATFNGTAGTGFGLLSARPATCTAKVAYWGTDTQTLYQCASANTWVSYYSPYTYPHPLVGGAVPIASVSPGSVTYSNQVINTPSSSQNITLSNIGSANLTTIAVSINGTNSGDFSETDNCVGATLAPSTSCTISVTFTPTVAAARSANVAITDNSGAQNVPLSGTGVNTIPAPVVHKPVIM